MKRSLLFPPDAFSIAPMLSLLPVKGDVTRLRGLSASFYARSEKVVSMQSEMSGAHGHELVRRLAAELGMLQLLLQWVGGATPGAQ